MRVLLLVLSLVSAAASAQGPAVPPPLADPASPSGRTVLTVGGVHSIKEVGVRAAFARRPITDAPWSFPVAVEASALVGGNGDGGLGGTAALGAAVHAARRLGRSTVYLQPGFQLSGGTGTVDYRRNTLFLGGRVSLDLIRYPTRRGLVAGVGIYGTQRLGSDLYTPRDAGISLTLGAQF